MKTLLRLCRLPINEKDLTYLQRIYGKLQVIEGRAPFRIAAPLVSSVERLVELYHPDLIEADPNLDDSLNLMRLFGKDGPKALGIPFILKCSTGYMTEPQVKVEGPPLVLPASVHANCVAQAFGYKFALTEDEFVQHCPETVVDLARLWLEKIIEHNRKASRTTTWFHEWEDQLPPKYQPGIALERGNVRFFANDYQLGYRVMDDQGRAIVRFFWRRHRPPFEFPSAETAIIMSEAKPEHLRIMFLWDRATNGWIRSQFRVHVPLIEMFEELAKQKGYTF